MSKKKIAPATVEEANQTDIIIVTDTEATAGMIPLSEDMKGITADILKHKNQIECSFMAVGKLLNEAKEKLAHGEWQYWLAYCVDFSESTARRCMRLARECAERPALTALGYTKGCMLLSLPEAEREDLLTQVHDFGGMPKSAADMTTRELETVVRERKRELKQANEEAVVIESGEKASVMSKKDFHTEFEYVHSCMEAVLAYLEEQSDMDTREDISSAIRNLCNGTLEKLVSLTPT